LPKLFPRSLPVSLLRRLLAVALAFLLPLQLGTALAVSVPMSVQGGAGSAHAGHLRAALQATHANAGNAANATHGVHATDGHALPSPHAGSAPCHQASLAGDEHRAAFDQVGGADPACSDAVEHDSLACLDCAFCLASFVALGAPEVSGLQPPASGELSASPSDRFDSRAPTPLDRPPIA